MKERKIMGEKHIFFTVFFGEELEQKEPRGGSRLFYRRVFVLLKYGHQHLPSVRP
jgi:hypothetical protein